MTVISVNLAAWGYGLAAFTYLALTVMILTSWRQRSQAYLLVAATFITAMWAVVETFSALNYPVSTLGLTLEAGRNGLWLALLLHILRLRIASMSPHLQMLQNLGGLLVVAMLIALATSTVSISLTAPVWLIHTGFVCITVLGLVAVEQVYRNTRVEDRWKP